MRRLGRTRQPAGTGRPVAEAAIVGGIAAAHVVDHRLVPVRFHLGTHLASAAAAVAAARAAGASLDDLGLGPARVRAALRRGVLGSLVIGAIVGAGALVPRTRPLFTDARVLDVSPGQVAYTSLVEIPFGTAVYEEVVFRGVILGLAMRHLNPTGAIAVSSALFGLWHILPALADREHHPTARTAHPAAVVAGAVAATTLAGVLFGVERVRTGSILAPVLTHATTNAVAYAVAAEVARRARTGSSWK